MPYLTDLADACRKSGLPVVEVPGWKTRGHGPMAAVRSVLLHHTATSAKAQGDYPSLRIVRDGYAGLPGPLSQLGLGRSGTVYVIAAGLCYHAGQTVNNWSSNAYSIGIEAEHDGITPFPEPMYGPYVRLVAALSEHYDWEDKPGPEDDAAVWGHREQNKVDGKIDPVFNMDVFRKDVADLKAGRGRFHYKEVITPQLEDGEGGMFSPEAQKWLIEQFTNNQVRGTIAAVQSAQMDRAMATYFQAHAPKIADAAVAQLVNQPVVQEAVAAAVAREAANVSGVDAEALAKAVVQELGVALAPKE